MKIFNNAISDNLQQECIQEIKQNSQKRVWTSSSIGWPEVVRSNIVGSCISCDVSADLSKQIEHQIKQYLPEHQNLILQFYVWQYNSGISLHDDHTYKFGATLYLNNSWHVNWGGIFLWYETMQDLEHGNCLGLIPQGKTLVVNDERQLHLVTPVSSSSPSFRITIQIWGE
jgi:hypothetical protein